MSNQIGACGNSVVHPADHRSAAEARDPSSTGPNRRERHPPARAIASRPLETEPHRDGRVAFETGGIRARVFEAAPGSTPHSPDRMASSRRHHSHALDSLAPGQRAIPVREHERCGCRQRRAREPIFPARRIQTATHASRNEPTRCTRCESLPSGRQRTKKAREAGKGPRRQPTNRLASADKWTLRQPTNRLGASRQTD